jgi:methyl-accepting chemotaxis protein
MKLHTKILLTLLVGVLVVSVAAQWFQRGRNAGVVRGIAQANLKLEEANQWEWVENLEQAVLTSLISTMAEGDMDKFTKALESQKSIKGLQELSLHGSAGRIGYSTLTNRLHQSLPTNLQARLLSSAEPYKQRTAESFELYRPVPVTKNCLECHNEYKEGMVSGVLVTKFTTDTLKEATQHWNGLVTTLNKSSFTTLLVTTLILALVTAGLVTQIVRYQVARPLNRIAGLLRTNSEQVGTASAAIAAASTTLAEDASQQAASLEETSSSLEEMASMTRGNAEHAGKVDLAARSAAQAAEAGMQDMQALAQAMESIKASGADVAKIARTIDEIAFQTNILALNAAVEAARAGEAGLGFAVVADEVRNLAQRSAQAAKEASTRIEESIQRGNHGAQLSEQVRGRLEVILAQVRDATTLASEVASACKEQEQGVSQINQAVSQMDRVTQSTAASSEESASAAQELKSQAEDLRGAVEDLVLLLDGKKPASTARAPKTTPKTPSGREGGNGAPHRDTLTPKVRSRSSIGNPVAV